MQKTIDDRWFKARQKEVGVTAEDIARHRGRSRSNISHILNGHQRMSPDWARSFAEVLQVDVATILEKAGVLGEQELAPLQAAAGDGDAVLWVGSGGSSHKVKQIAAAFDAHDGMEIWRVQARSMELAGLLRGDFALVDTHLSELARPGDTVIARVYSRGAPRTVLRRWMPPVLIAHCPPADEEPVYVVDNDNVVIYGKVVASWRTS